MEPEWVGGWSEPGKGGVVQRDGETARLGVPARIALNPYLTGTSRTWLA